LCGCFQAINFNEEEEALQLNSYSIEIKAAADKKMRSLHIDFTNYNGHQMVISGKEAIRRNDLHELELNMISDNMIRILLPMSWLEVDDSISFNYQIIGFRLAAHHLRTQQLTMERYYSLLLSLADGLATCYDYMLRPHCCLIDEQMLYIDEAMERIGIVYLPLQQPYTEHLGQSLLLLAVRWSGLVANLDAAGYHRILQLLSSEELPINPLRQLLLDLIHEQTQHSSKRIVFNDNSPRGELDYHLSQAADQAAESKHSFNKQQNSRGTDTYVESSIHSRDEGEGAGASRLSVMRSILANTPQPSFQHVNELEEEDDEFEYADMNERLTWKHYAIIALIAAAIGLTWIKLYTGEQSFDQLLLCSGITIGFLALLALILLKPIKALISSSRLEEPIEFDLMTEHAVRASTQLSSRIASDLHHGEPSSSNTAYKPNSPSNAQEAVASQNTRHNATEHAHPKLAAKGNPLATVKLDELQATAMLNQQPMLVRSLHGAEERIMLNETTFLIGRAEDGVHYQEAAKGVSRVHLELEWNNGKVQVKDVGSRNGTYLNGQLMIAYKAYLLQAGDKLQLASLEGPVYELVS